MPPAAAAALARESTFDLVVIGGGINGAAIAREAALGGLGVLLLERDDLCAGTSAVSTRLIHGGLRYLEHAEFSLVRESLAERERLLETAPHLVAPLEILLPLMRSARRGPIQIRLGMLLYDLLSIGKSLPRHRMLSKRGLIERLPAIAADDLVAGASYFDAQVDYPERLVLENALDAQANGATIATRTAAMRIRSRDGKVEGVEWAANGASGFARATAVVNAAGPWVDDVLASDPSARLIGGTKGSHVIAARFHGAPEHALYAEAASDGRPFFIIPWNGLYLIGTTDERYDGDPGNAQISEAEFAYLMAETRRLFPRASDLEERVCYTCAGIRPLPSTTGVKEGAITRRHLIKRHRETEGLYSIIGGKLTTHRALAVDCLRRLRRIFPSLPASRTAERPLPGALAGDERDRLIAELESRLGRSNASRLWRTYGGRSRELVEHLRGSRELGRTLGPESDCLVGELTFAIELEFATSLVDLLQRRTMVGLGPDFGKRAAPLAADWMVRLGYWDKTRAAAEVTAYRRYSRRFAVPRDRDRAD